MLAQYSALALSVLAVTSLASPTPKDIPFPKVDKFAAKFTDGGNELNGHVAYDVPGGHAVLTSSEGDKLFIEKNAGYLYLADFPVCVSVEAETEMNIFKNVKYNATIMRNGQAVDHFVNVLSLLDGDGNNEIYVDHKNHGFVALYESLLEEDLEFSDYTTTVEPSLFVPSQPFEVCTPLPDSIKSIKDAVFVAKKYKKYFAKPASSAIEFPKVDKFAAKFTDGGVVMNGQIAFDVSNGHVALATSDKDIQLFVEKDAAYLYVTDLPVCLSVKTETELNIFKQVEYNGTINREGRVVDHFTNVRSFLDDVSSNEIYLDHKDHSFVALYESVLEEELEFNDYTTTVEPSAFVPPMPFESCVEAPDSIKSVKDAILVAKKYKNFSKQASKAIAFPKVEQFAAKFTDGGLEMNGQIAFDVANGHVALATTDNDIQLFIEKDAAYLYVTDLPTCLSVKAETELNVFKQVEYNATVTRNGRVVDHFINVLSVLDDVNTNEIYVDHKDGTFVSVYESVLEEELELNDYTTTVEPSAFVPPMPFESCVEADPFASVKDFVAHTLKARKSLVLQA